MWVMKIKRMPITTLVKYSRKDLFLSAVKYSRIKANFKMLTLTVSDEETNNAI